MWIAEILGAALQADGEPRSALNGLKHQKQKHSMDCFAGLDVSVKETSVCIVDGTGKIVREAKVASEPAALLAVLKNPAYHFKRIGFGSRAVVATPVLRRSVEPAPRKRTLCDFD